MEHVVFSGTDWIRVFSVGMRVRITRRGRYALADSTLREGFGTVEALLLRDRIYSRKLIRRYYGVPRGRVEFVMRMMCLPVARVIVKRDDTSSIVVFPGPSLGCLDILSEGSK